MREIYLNYLTQKKDEKKLSYDDLVPRTAMSKSKLQRIFTGQNEPTVSDLEIIVEKGFCISIKDLYAKIGEQEMKASEELDFKGAEALMDEFAAEKARIHANYETRIAALIEQGDKRQQAFSDGMRMMETQYRKNADYLTGIIKDNEGYIRDLLAKTEHANAISVSAQQRAEAAEKKVAELDRRRYQVFWSMLFVIIILVGVIAASVVLNIPAIGWGNP